MKNYKKLIIFALILLLVVFLILIFLFIKNKLKYTNSETSQSATPTINFMEDWQSYTDPNYKYSFQYPPEMVLKNISDNSIIINTQAIFDWQEKNTNEELKNLPPFIGITAYNSLSELTTKSSTLAEFIDKNEKSCVDTKIDDIQGYLCNVANTQRYIYVQKDSLIYKIDLDPVPESSKRQQITLDTIKFN